MYGQSRDYSCRLLETAYVGDDELKIEPGLDWQAGETIGIAATNMRTMDFDYCKIESYNSGSGLVKCEEELEGYHYGAGSSSEDDYGVDMRAEVFVLERNIKIQASTDDIGSIIKEAWGGRILVADFFEPSLTLRKGSLIMDNVQVYNCSQKQTYKSAIKWE